MYILVENDVVIAVTSQYEKLDTGTLIGDIIFPMGKIVEIDDQEEVIPQKHLYKNGKIELNQVYIQSVENQIREAIDKYTLELIDGGLL